MKRNKGIYILLLAAGIIYGINVGLCEASDNTSDIRIKKLEFENAPIRTIMKTLSEIGNQNIVLDQKITESSTIYLSNLSWKEAFLAVLKMNNLIAYEDAGFIKVIKLEDFTAQLKAMEEKVRFEKLIKPITVQVIKIHNARAEDIKKTLDPLLGKENASPNSSTSNNSSSNSSSVVSVDLRTNSLVFTVSDSTFAVLSKIVKDLDTETRQVSIEVKMVTLDSNSLSEIGINWSAVNNADRSITQNAIVEEGKFMVGKWAGSTGATDFFATVATLIDKNKAEVVSRPLVVTQDNEPAMISSGQEIPVVTYDEARNTVIELIQASTELNVTPHILSDNRILLDVDATRKTADGVGVGLKINEESAVVKMITSNGETAVIGGMRQAQESKFESGIPILQDIPLIGQIFKYTKREIRKTDLIIFITPRIVENVEAKLND